MKITDSNALKLIEEANSNELDIRIENLDEIARDMYCDDPDISDLEVLKNEIDYLVDNFNEDGHCLHDDLHEARAFIRNTKNGKVFELTGCDLALSLKRNKARYNDAVEIVDEYKRIKKLQGELRKV